MAFVLLMKNLMHLFSCVAEGVKKTACFLSYLLSLFLFFTFLSPLGSQNPESSSTFSSPQLSSSGEDGPTSPLKHVEAYLTVSTQEEADKLSTSSMYLFEFEPTFLIIKKNYRPTQFLVSPPSPPPPPKSCVVSL